MIEYVPFILTIAAAIVIGLVVLIDVKSVTVKGVGAIKEYEDRLIENTAAMKELTRLLTETSATTRKLENVSEHILDITANVNINNSDKPQRTNDV